MKITTKFFIAALTISLILTVSAVAAVDDTAFNQSDIKASDFEVEKTVHESDYEILKDGEGTYEDLISEIGFGGDKNLNKSYYRYTGGDAIEITSPGVIDGKGAVIDMNGSDIRVFTVTTSGVTIKNLSIKNANVIDNGGAIYFIESGTVINCTFTDNTANGDGGAVYFSDGGTVTNSNFAHNTAGNWGGAIMFLGNGTVTDCDFTANKATPDTSCYGGAVCLYGFGTVKNSNFTHNTVGDYGGAIYFYNTGNATNCNFANNTAIRGYGGAVYCDHYTELIKCNFTNNKADSDAGAIHFSYSGKVESCNFNNNQAKNGGGIYFTWDGTVANCNFTSNKADSDGGAVYFDWDGNVTNCNFIKNTATGSGGAVYFDSVSEVIKCSFTGNKAGSNGGAVYFDEASEIENCNFKDNYAHNGGAIYFNDNIYNIKIIASFKGNTAENTGGAIFFKSLAENNTFKSIFMNNYALYGGSIFFKNKANNNRFNSNFTSNIAKSCGGAIFFYSTTNNNNFTGYYINNSALGQVSPEVGNGGAITFKDVSTNCLLTCEFINNTAALYGGGVNYRQTPHNITFNGNFINNNASTGGGVNFFESFENIIFNSKFIGNSAGNGSAIAANNGIVKDVSFNDNHAQYGGAVYFGDYGEVENCNFTNNAASEYGGAIFFTGAGNVTNCSFTSNSARFGGAVEIDGNGNVRNCNFIDNRATDIYASGGAVYFDKTGNVSNCNFINNKATSDYGYGGAIWFNDDSNVGNCNFTGNIAASGSAITFWSQLSTNTVSNSFFLNNRANTESLKVVKNEYNITITFTGNNNLLNAIYSNDEVSFTNVTYLGANGITNTGNSPIIPSRSRGAAGQNISVGVVVNGEIVLNTVKVTDEEGMIVLDMKTGDNYFIGARHETDSYYTEAEKAISIMTFNVNVISQTTTDKKVNLTAKTNILGDVITGKLLFILPNGTEITANYASNGTWWAVHTFKERGNYTVNASYTGLDNVKVNNATVNIKMIQTVLSADDITVTYHNNRNLVITLTDIMGNPLSGEKITVELNGINNYTTDKNGQVKINAANLAPKTYTAKITFIGSADYITSSLNVKVTVKKATPKLIAKKKKFKAKSTKKFKVTLKDKNGQAIRNVKVTLKIKKLIKKTGKTNSKGKVTFKIKKNRKGKYKGKVKFSGNQYYNKVTKKVKIVIK